MWAGATSTWAGGARSFGGPKLRALWVIHYPVFGGPHNRVLRLASPLRAAGVDLTVAIPAEPGTASGRLRAGGLDVVEMPLHRLRASVDPRRAVGFLATVTPEIRELRRLIRERDVDVVVVGGLANPHAAIAGHLEDRAVVWQILDSRTPRVYCRGIRPLVERCADVAQFGAQALVGLNFGERPLRCPIAVLRPGVDTALFAPSDAHRRRVRSELGIPRDAVVVGTVANVNAQKGIEWFVRAAALLHRQDPSLFFVVVGAMNGGDPYAHRIRGEVTASGLPVERIHFTGSRSDVERFYPAFDVKLITSVPRSEGTTTTAMESLACEVPVVSTDVGAVREVIEDGRTGLIVPPEDAAALAGGAQQLIADAQRRRAMGELGRRVVEERFSLGHAADRQLAIFDQAIAHRSARSRARLR